MTRALGFPVDIPFMDHLGVRLESAADGHCLLRLSLQPLLHNSFGVAHGGVVMSLLDVAMAQAARSVAVAEESAAPVQPGAQARPDTQLASMATIEMKTSFFKPAQGELTAKGQVVQRTATLAFCEASVFDAAGQRCAAASGTFKYMRALVPRSAVAAK